MTVCPAAPAEPPTAPEFVVTAMPTHVRFADSGGWPGERKLAERQLTVGREYLLLRLDVGCSSSTVVIADLNGLPRGTWNTAMFDFLAWAYDLDAAVPVVVAGGGGTENGDQLEAFADGYGAGHVAGAAQALVHEPVSACGVPRCGILGVHEHTIYGGGGTENGDQ